MSTTPTILPQRVASTWVFYTRWQRFRIWVAGVVAAVRHYPGPETGYFKTRLVMPGEPGYDDPFNQIVVSKKTTISNPPIHP